MALPTLTKTWQFNVNNASAPQGSVNADAKRAIRLIKDALKGFASNPWSVQGSCNGAGGAGSFSSPPGGTDKWLTDADIVGNNPGSNHSWIVLRQTGIASNYEVCFDMASTSLTALSCVVSPSAGFTGGSATNRPTATDEVAVATTSFTWIALAADLQVRWNVMQSSDGQCTRVWTAAGGSYTGMMIFDKPANPVSGWSNPSASWCFSATPNANNLFNSSSFIGKMRSGSTNGNVLLLAEGLSGQIGFANATWGNIANEISLEWPMWPLGFACDTVGIRGRMGSLFDLWAGSNAVAMGDTYPGDGSSQFVQIGNLILPWNGGPVNLT